MGLLIYILNAVLYIILLFFIYKNKKTLVFPLAVLFLISAFCSILYYGTPLYENLTERKNDVPSYMALLFIYVNFIIYIYPLYKVKLYGDSIPYYKGVVIFTEFLGIIAIIPTIEMVQLLLHTSVTDMAEQYELNQTESVDIGSQLSSIARNCNGIITWFSYITPVLFFYVVTQKAKIHIILLGLFALLEPTLGPILRGGRGQLFMLVMLVIFNYVLFYIFFPNSTKRKLSRIGIIAIILVIFLLVSMTLARSSSETDLALLQIFRYVGEGFVNFAETGWYSERFTGGHSIFNGTGFTWMKEFGDFFQQRDWQGMTNYMKIRMYVYYTVFGDYYLDFGLLGALLFNLFISIIFFKKINNKHYKLYVLIIINIYARIGMNGIYCYYYMNYMEFLLFSLLVTYLLYLYENQFSIKKRK